MRSRVEDEDEAARLIAPFVSAGANGVTVDLQLKVPHAVSTAPGGAGSISRGCELRQRYVILDRLGTGGKGSVFRALDRYRTALLGSAQHVALKVLHTGNAGSDPTDSDLALELHCGQVLSHRNIVKVFELDRDGDVVFFTMELLDGELLSDLIERMSPAGMQLLQAWQIIRQLGAGLQHAHERGVVHGDLKPRNILVTRNGEVRILDFGSARKMGRAQESSGRPGVVSGSGTPAYASWEQLQGRAADSRDDLYALACISYELLTSAHPFAGRPATVARNFDVKAMRPASLTGRQWRTLESGLTWHRAGRPKSVLAWIQRLTHGIAENPSITPLHELKPAGAARTFQPSRVAVALLAVLLIAGVGIGGFGETAQKTGDNATRTVPDSAKVPIPEPVLPSVESAPENGLIMSAMVQAKPATTADSSMVTVDGYQVSSGDRYVEVRVHRNQLRKGSSFEWWTEPATARQGVDYVRQGKAIQTFPTAGLATRFYVKLLPGPGRTQPDFFYVDIAQPGRDRNPGKVTRAQIWLPTSRDQLQARR